MKLRPSLLWIHRWVGVFAGLVILVVAITGGVLVFERTLSRWLHPELFPSSTRTGQRALVADSIRNLETRQPGVRIQGIMLPRHDREALVLFTPGKTAHADPQTGEILGLRPRANPVLQTLVRLHVNLMAGSTGGTVVVVATVVTMGLALTGLCLWWPLKITWFRRGVNFRRFNLDLHSVAGLYSSLFLLIIALTGVTLRYLHGEHPRPLQSDPPPPPRTEITTDDAIAQAEKALPGARAMSLEMPKPNPRSPFRVQLAFPEDGSPAGRSVVFLNKFSGDTLGIHSSRDGTLLERYQNMHLSLHTGSILGTPTKWLALLTCVALVLQIASGYVLWWKRKDR